MTIQRCDKCRKTIKSKAIFVGIERFYNNVELCNSCGQGVIDFLVANDLLVDKLVKNKYIKLDALN